MKVVRSLENAGLELPERFGEGRNCGHGPTGGLCHQEPKQMVRGTDRLGSLEGNKEYHSFR